jgi:exopolysaccharide production repressor protein
MSFSIFLLNLVGVSIVFALTTYLTTGSWWTTLIQTIICAVLVQVGYFAAVLFSIWRSGTQKNGANAPKSEPAQGLAKDEKPAGKIGQLPGAPRSRHP